MLTVKIQNGDEMERTFYVNDLQDLKRVQDNLVDDFQKVLIQDKSEEKIELERVLDASPCDTTDELIALLGDIADVCEGNITRFKEIADMKNQLDNTDYDSVEDMADDNDTMKEVMYEIYSMVRDWA